MNCALSAKQQKQLLIKVYKDIQKEAKKETQFDIEGYIKNFYDSINDKTQDQALALTYAQLVPEFINYALTGRKELVKSLRAKGFSRDNLEDIIESFEDMENVLATVTDKKITAEELADIKKENKRIAQKIQEKRQPEDVTNETELLKEQTFKFKFKPLSFLSTTGYETIKDTDVKDPEQIFYYDFLHKFYDQFINVEDPKKITIAGHTGFGLKAVSKKKTKYEHLRPDEQRLVKNEKKRWVVDQGVGVFVTDVEGNILYFDETYNIVDESQGRPIFFNIRSIKKENGEYKGSIHTTQSPEEMAKNMGISLEEATELHQSRLEELFNLKNIVLTGQDVILDVTGVSKGVLNIRKEEGSTRINDINWDDSDIEKTIKIADKTVKEIGETAGQAYISISGYRSIPLQSDNLSLDDINKVLDILFLDNLKDEFGGDILPDKRIKLAKHLVYSNPAGIEFMEKNGKVKVTLEGQEVTNEDRDKIIKVLTRSYISKKDIESDIYATTSGQYNFHEDKKGDFEEFYIKDGKVYTEYVPLEEHIAEHSTMEIIPNENALGEPVITFLNGYFSFSIPSTKKQAKKALEAKPEEVKPEVSQTNITTPKNLFTVEPKQAVDKKAKSKAKIATQYIGFAEGISGSSTALYAEQAGQYANTGDYNSNDVVFVSVPGKRGSAKLQKQNQDRTIKEATKAVEAGAIIITDNKAYIDSNSYNTGEKRLFANMQAKGYIYSEVIVDGQTLGTWSKSTQPQAGVKPEIITTEDITETPKTVLPIKEKVESVIESEGIVLKQTEKEPTELKAEQRIEDSVQLLNEYSNSQLAKAIRKPEEYLGKLINKTEKQVEGGKAIQEEYEQGIVQRIFTDDGSKIQRVTDLTGQVHGIPLINLTMDAKEAGLLFDGKSDFSLSEKQITDFFNNKFKQTPKVEEKKRKRKPRKGDLGALTSARINPMKSTPEEIAKAKEWYDNSPLAKYMGYEEMFNVINSNAWADFTHAGIKLYAGSNYTVLYHEAWHVFSQHYLSPEEKTELYNEVAKTLEGKEAIQKWADKKKVKPSQLSEMQKFKAIEELLAEGFRKYVLSDGKDVIKGQPVRNTIFRRILNFLKELFGKLTNTDYSGSSTYLKVEDLYAKLHIGNINEYSPSEKNAFFGETALYSSPDVIEEDTWELSEQDTQLMLQSMDGLASIIVDEWNAELGDTRATSAIFSKPEEFLYNLYADIEEKLEDRETELQEEWDNATGVEKQELERKIAILTTVLDNYGSYEDNTGFVAFHLNKSKYLKEHIKNIDQDVFRKTKEDIDAARFDVAANELDKISLANTRLLFLLGNIRKYDSDRKPEVNNLGFPVLMRTGEVIGLISTIVGEKNDDVQDIYNSLQDSIKEFPWVASLLNKLGEPNTDYTSVFKLWTGLRDILHMSEQKLHSVMINEITDENGDVKFEITSGYRATVFRKVEQEFKSQFKLANHPNKYIVDTGKFGNVLNTKAILADFKGKLNTPEQRFNFIRAIGIPLSDNKSIIDGFKGDRISVKYIYDKLELLNLVNEPITDILETLRAHQVVQLKSGKQIIPSQTSNVNKILSLEAKHSGNYNSSAVQTVEGNQAYEYARMSSRASMVMLVNSVEDFDELIRIPEMAHLNPATNPRVKGSIILKTLFFYNKETESFGKKRPGAKLIYDVADGVQNINDGITTDDDYSQSTSKADKYARLMQDFYSMMLEGKQVGVTPADKGTIPMVNLNKILKDGKDDKVYVDTADFTKEINGVNVGILKAFNILLPSLEGELEEMRLINSKDPSLPRIPGFTLFIKDKDGNEIPPRGADFSTFAGMFTDATKKALKKEYAEKGDLRSMSEELRSKILEDFTNYIKFNIKQVKETADRLLYISSELKDKLKQEAENNLLKDNDILNYYVASYATNKIIHNIDQVTFFYGSIAQFKDFDKRNPSIDSAGRVARTDALAMNFINSNITSEYAESKGIRTPDLSPILNAGIFQDDIDTSAAIKEIEKNLTKDLGKRIKKKTILKKAVESRLKPYKNMEISDAQGYITFDAYRQLGILTNRWSDQQEALYQKIVHYPDQVKIDDVLEYFPVRKYQYAGALQTEKLHATAFHKFSLLPLIPTVIKGTKLEQVHDMMMKNNIHYATYKTGSKVSTIVAKDKEAPDNIFNKDRSINTELPITKNKVFLRYLKDQLDINSEFKGKVIFSTQLRKLIERGLIENGKPVDYPGTLEEWEEITDEKERMKTSKFYEKYKTYENKIQRLADFRKAELIKEVGSTPKEFEQGKGDVSKLINFVKRELQHQDLTNEELAFIGVNDKGQLINDLSNSPSAAQIEKLLNSLVNNRLIRQKVNGEALVQVSNALFEATNPTEADLDKYQTRDLKFYRRDPNTGETLPMEVKVALQGKFKKLLQLQHNDGKKVAVYKVRKKQTGDGKIKNIKEIDEAKSLARLNEMITDKSWLAKKANRDMITMVAVRIPVQGHNSMEYMIVKQFLPQAAGNIIVPPAEIVAKSGSDFDVDKLTVIMPSIVSTVDGPQFLEEVNTKDPFKNLESIESIKEKIKDLKAQKVELIKLKKALVANEEYFSALDVLEKEYKEAEGYVTNLEKLKYPSQANLDLLEKMRIKAEEKYQEHSLLYDEYEEYLNENGITDDTINEVKEQKKELDAEISRLSVQMAQLGGDAIQNSLLTSIKDILALEHNYENLITPNDTSIVKDEEGAYGTLKRIREEEGAGYSDKVGAFQKGSFEATRYFEPGYNIYKHESNAVGKETLGLGAVANTWDAIFNRVGAYMNLQYNVAPEWKKKKEMRRVNILMDHNKMTVNGQQHVSLSHIYDANNEHKIGDLINQLMNGWVDVAKEAWIFDIQGNKEVTPIIDFLLQAGVPFDSAIYFVSNPLVKDYVKKQNQAKSAFSKVARLNPDVASKFKNEARSLILKSIGTKSVINTDTGQIINTKALYEEILEATQGKDFTNKGEEIAKLKLDDAYKSQDAKAAFLHFLELEDIATEVANIKLKLNYDTSRSNTLFDAAKREAEFNMITKGNIIPSKVIKDIITESPIGSFKISKFQLKLWGPLFKVRNHKNLNRYIIEEMVSNKSTKNMKKMFGDTERYIETFKNDLIVKLYLDEIKKPIDLKGTYKGFPINDVKGKKIKPTLENGVTIIPDKKTGYRIFIDTDILDKDFENNNYSQLSSTNRAPIPTAAFAGNKDEYYRFAIEKEYQRVLNPFSKLAETPYFEYKYNLNLEKFKDLQTDKQEDKENRILKTTYEEMLRDKALTNILNFWKLFKSPVTFADELFEIKEMHPELNDKYDIVNNLIMSQGNKKIKNKIVASYKNISLRDNRVPSEDMNIYNINMSELRDPAVNSISIITEADKLENRRIAEFFDMLPVIGFLQSGLNSKDSISVMKAVPFDKVSEQLDSIREKTLDMFNDYDQLYNYLSNYRSLFNQHNATKNQSVRRRTKDYTDISTIGKPNYGLTSTSLPVVYSYDGTNILNGQMFDKVLDEEVSAITTQFDTGIRKGDVFEITQNDRTKDDKLFKRSVLVRATANGQSLQDVNKEEWALTTGNAESSYKGLSANKSAMYVPFELVSDEEIMDAEDIKELFISPGNKNQLESLIKNNPNVIFVLEDKGEFSSSEFKDYNNIQKLVTSKTVKELKTSLKKLKDLLNSDVKVAFMSERVGYATPEFSKTDSVDYEIYKKLTEELYSLTGYMNNRELAKTAIKDTITTTQQSYGITEYSLEIPYDEVNKVRERLNCKL